MKYRIFVMIRHIAIFSCIIQICASESQSPLVFSNWPPTKTPSFRHQIMMALRPMMRQAPPDFLYKRAPPLLPQPQRLVRPMKLAVNAAPYFLLKNHLTAYKRPTSTPLTSNLNFQSSPPGPNTGEYVYENPFTSNTLQTTSKSPSCQSGSTIRLNADRFNPIHTIPAPNLSQLETMPAWKSKVENDYYEKQHPVFLPQRPNDIHQYQVTEETNDHTINDLVSGTRKLYAPDPDPSLPAFKIKPATDPFSQPSNTNFQTLHPFGTLPPSALIQSPTSSVQFGSSNPPIQQKFFQQQSIVQGMPSVYNPTYLVTQSNQLLDQHKRHLFQPEIHTSKEKSNFIAEATSNSEPVQSVASPGQIMTAAKDKMSEIGNYELLPSNPSPLISGQYSASLPENVNPTLTEKEVSDLINFGKLYDNSDQNSFVASSYYDSFPETQVDFDITQQQRDNEEILRQANGDIAAIKASVTSNPTTASITMQHQQRLAEQFQNVPLRIIVPETNGLTDANSNDVKRSDNFSNESNTEADSYLELDNRVTISEPSDPNSEYRSEEITKDEKTESIGSYEYYSNDSTEDMVYSS